MEKQRSLSCKSTRFMVLSITLSFSLVLLSFLFCWAMQASPFIHQEANYYMLNASSLSLSLNQLNLQSLTVPSKDAPIDIVNYTVYTTNLTNTHVINPDISPGSVSNSTVGVSVKSIGVKVNTVKRKVFGDLSARFSADKVKVANLRGTHLRRSQNASGFVRSLNSSGKSGDFHGGDVRGNVSNGGEERRHEKLQYLETSGGGEVDEIVNNRSGVCDVTKGRWVFDENYPLYTNFSCPFIDEGFDCQGNGRLDKDYMKWRWQPQDCDIPRFNATNMLEVIRGKRLVFAGDSINRNQWESLLCLLMGAAKDPKKVYETRGRRITKQRGAYSFRFVDYQCTVEFYVSHFLVREGKARVGRKRKETLRIDSIDRESAKWKGADILVFNTGNWWSHSKTKSGRNYYMEGDKVYPHLDAVTAYRKALVTWALWVDKFINPRKTLVFFRSTAPAHFRGGEWNTGGHCRKVRTPLTKMYVVNPEKDIIAQEVISTMKTPVNFLNVSGLSSYRIDGHPSKYGRHLPSSVEDCSHWCLPGVPDAWNELLYHQLLLLKQQKSVYIG